MKSFTHLNAHNKKYEVKVKALSIIWTTQQNFNKKKDNDDMDHRFTIIYTQESKSINTRCVHNPDNQLKNRRRKLEDCVCLDMLKSSSLQQR
jgi:hypothetical protein